MKSKPYRSLDQVYLSESFAKSVPLLPRQQVLREELKQGREKHYTQPSVQFHLPGIEPEEGRTLPKAEMGRILGRKIKKTETPIAYTTPEEEKQGESELIDIAKKIIGGGGEGAEDAAMIIVGKLRKMNNNKDKNIEYANVKGILVDLSKPANKINNLPPQGRSNLVDVIYKETKNKYLTSPELIRAMLNTVGRGSANLGKVELGLTIFYKNARKAIGGGDIEIQRGDYNSIPLQIGTVTYEVKGTDGRMGKGNPTLALKNIETYMNNFYKKYNINKQFGQVNSAGGDNTTLITNIYMCLNEIVSIESSTIKDIFGLIFYKTPKEIKDSSIKNTIFNQFIEASNNFKKEAFSGALGEELIKLLSTALQMQTYKLTDGQDFDNLLAFNDNFNAFIVDVNGFDFMKYYNIVDKYFIISRPSSDQQHGTFGISLK